MEIKDLERLPPHIQQQITALDQFAIVSFADLEGNITYVNDLFCSTSGYSRDELIGRNHRILKSRLQPEILFSEMWRTISSGKVWKGEVLNKKKNGGYYWVDTTIVPCFDPDARLSQYVSIRVDITRQKERLIEIEKIVDVVRKAKEELKFLNTKLENKYVSVLENMNDAFVINDSAGKIRFANRRFYEIFKMSKQSVVGEKLVDFIYQPDRKVVELTHKKGIEGIESKDVIEVRAIENHESLVWLELKVTLVKEDGNSIGTQFIIRDITERKKAESVQFELAELNRKIIETSDDLFYVIDVQNENSLNNQLKYISPQVNVILGISESEISSRKNRWIDDVHPDDLIKLKHATFDLFLSRKPVIARYRVFNPILNEYVWVDDYSSPFVNARGKIIEIYGSVKDVNEQVIAGEKIAHEQQHALEIQYQLLCSQLDPHFVYNVLNSCQYYILNGKIEESLNYIAAFSGLMRKVLDYSRQQSVISFAEEIAFIEQYIEISKHRRNHDLKVMISVAPEIDIHEHLIPSMLLQPYVENVFLHAFPGHIKSPELLIRFEKSKHRITCVVADNGVGRNKTVESTKSGNLRRKSHAIQINQTRIDLLNKIHPWNFIIEIEDKGAVNSSETGTIVRISFNEILDG